MAQHWDKLKQLLRHLDPAGRTLVARADMKEVFKVLHFGVNESDTEQLLQTFTAHDSGLLVDEEYWRI